MIDLNDVDKAVLEFIDGTMETIHVTDVVREHLGTRSIMWIEGYSVNVVGPKPNPITVFPWHNIKTFRPLA